MEQHTEANEDIPHIEIVGMRKNIEDLKEATGQLVHRLRNRLDEGLMSFLDEGDIETLSSIAITLETLDTRSELETALIDRSIEDLMRVLDSIELRNQRGLNEDLESLLGLKRNVEAITEVAASLEHTFGQARRVTGQTGTTEALAARLKEVATTKSWYLGQRAYALAEYFS